MSVCTGLVDNDFAQHWEYGELFWFQTITHVLVPQRYRTSSPLPTFCKAQDNTTRALFI
jgi:hypothetical protein